MKLLGRHGEVHLRSFLCMEDVNSAGGGGVKQEPSSSLLEMERHQGGVASDRDGESLGMSS